MTKYIGNVPFVGKKKEIAFEFFFENREHDVNPPYSRRSARIRRRTRRLPRELCRFPCRPTPRFALPPARLRGGIPF